MPAKTKSLKRPIVMYNITRDCQLRCRHCYNESGGKSLQSPTSDELIRNTIALSEVAGAINFTGGEPLMRPELEALLKLSSARGVDNIITTNGLLLQGRDGDEMLERIQDDVYMLKIGMMGAVPETNDVIRGKGHFDIATKILDKMAKYSLVSCIKVSIDRHNMDEIEDFAGLAADHGVGQIVFGQLVQSGRAASYLSELVLDSDELKRVDDEISRVKEQYRGTLKIARHCTISGLCQEPGHFYTVTADGAMSPCLMREDLAIGDIAEDIPGLMLAVDAMRQEVTTHTSVRRYDKQGAEIRDIL